MKRIRVSASFMTGAVALVFLIIGYQTALFLHKSAMLKILGNRDRPDTVYVIDPEMARAVLAEARPDSAAAFRSVPGLPEKPAAADDRLYVRKDSEHHPAVAEIRSSIPSGVARRAVRDFVDPGGYHLERLFFRPVRGSISGASHPAADIERTAFFDYAQIRYRPAFPCHDIMPGGFYDGIAFLSLVNKIGSQ